MGIVHVSLLLVRGSDATDRDLWNLALANLVGFLVIAWAGWKRTRRPAARVFALRPSTLRLLPPLLVVSVTGMLVTAFGVDALFGFLPLPESINDLLEEFSETLSHIVITALPSAIVAVVIVAPLSEEFFFRGLVLDGFRKRYGDAHAVVFSAFLFGFFHLIPTQAVYAFFVGLFLGWLRLRTGSLYPCLFVHAVVNGVAVAIMRLEATHEPLEPTGSSLPGILMALVILLLGARWLSVSLPPASASVQPPTHPAAL